MIKIKEYEVRNTVEELTVSEFEKIASIQNDLGLDYVEKQIQVFTTLGVPEEIFDDMDIREFKDYVRQFNDVPAKEYPFLN